MCQKGFQSRGCGVEPLASVVLSLVSLEVRCGSPHKVLHPGPMEGMYGVVWM